MAGEVGVRAKDAGAGERGAPGADTAAPGAGVGVAKATGEAQGVGSEAGASAARAWFGVRTSLVEVAAALGGRVRYRNASDLGFRGGEVVALETRGEVVVVTTSLPALCGAETPLPLALADEIDRDDEHGEALRGLLDAAHHGLISTLVAGLAELDEAGEGWRERLLGLTAPLGEGVPPGLRLALLPLLIGPRGAEGLAAALRVALAGLLPAGAEVRVETFVGGWTEVAAEQRCRLGEAATTLEVDLLLGDEVTHPAGAARVVIGPLDEQAAGALARSEAALAAAWALCRAWAPELRLEMALEIEAPAASLGALGGRRVGEDLWLAADEGGRLRVQRCLPVSSPSAPS